MRFFILYYIQLIKLNPIKKTKTRGIIMKFECKICHYVAEGDKAPEVCPVCKQSGQFEAKPALKGSKTEENLWTAFAGESQARNKYTYFASKAKKEGFVQIAAIFTFNAYLGRGNCKKSKIENARRGGPVERFCYMIRDSE